MLFPRGLYISWILTCQILSLVYSFLHEIFGSEAELNSFVYHHKSHPASKAREYNKDIVIRFRISKTNELIIATTPVVATEA